jgi:hypothetical protein
MTRSTKIIRTAVIALAITAAVAVDAPVARAAACGGTQGTPLLLGCDDNSATDGTVLNVSTDQTGLFVRNTGSNGDGVDSVASAVGMFTRGGYIGVDSVGGTYGVRGSGGPYGVFGDGSKYGVYGAGGTYGVYGASAVGCGLGACGVGTLGTNTGTGVGVYGSSANGIGVDASSANGTALLVIGKAIFSRSGMATIAGTASAPRNSVLVQLPITAKSMMTATSQSYVPGVYVVAAVPTTSPKTGSYVGFTIYLNKSVTTSVGPIAWQVIERP